MKKETRIAKLLSQALDTKLVCWRMLADNINDKMVQQEVEFKNCIC